MTQLKKYTGWAIQIQPLDLSLTIVHYDFYGRHSTMNSYEFKNIELHNNFAFESNFSNKNSFPT